MCLKQDVLGDQDRKDLAASFQYAAMAHLVDRLKLSVRNIAERNIPIQAMTIVGGVAANRLLGRFVYDALFVLSFLTMQLEWCEIH